MIPIRIYSHNFLFLESFSAKGSRGLEVTVGQTEGIAYLQVR